MVVVVGGCGGVVDDVDDVGADVVVGDVVGVVVVDAAVCVGGARHCRGVPSGVGPRGGGLAERWCRACSVRSWVDASRSQECRTSQPGVRALPLVCSPDMMPS